MKCKIATGARVAAAKIVAESKGSALKSEGESNGSGEFRIEGLLPGAYHVTVTASGFAEASADVDVVVSMVRDVNVTLEAGGSPGIGECRG